MRLLKNAYKDDNKYTTHKEKNFNIKCHNEKHLKSTLKKIKTFEQKIQFRTQSTCEQRALKQIRRRIQEIEESNSLMHFRRFEKCIFKTQKALAKQSMQIVLTIS